jgi:hypothetical protein
MQAEAMTGQREAGDELAAWNTVAMSPAERHGVGIDTVARIWRARRSESRGS